MLLLNYYMLNFSDIIIDFREDKHMTQNNETKILTVDDYLKSFNKTTRIFLNKNVFEMSYSPEAYLYRDPQLNKMVTHSQSLSYGMSPHNFLLTGGYATGKTSVLKYYFKILDEGFDNVINSYINCKLQHTEHQIFGKIYQQIFGKHCSTLGKPTEFLFNKIVEYLVDNEKILVVGLDDFDNLKNRRSLNKLLYSLLRAHEVEPTVQISVITVSNRGNILIDPDVETMFNRVPVYFDQYNMNQMYNILKLRCDYGFYPRVISDDLIKFVARKAYDDGDLRYAIKLLNRAGEEAEKAGTGKIIKEYLE